MQELPHALPVLHTRQQVLMGSSPGRAWLLVADGAHAANVRIMARVRVSARVRFVLIRVAGFVMNRRLIG